MPPTPDPCKLTFDILTLKVVFDSRVTWATSANFSLHRRLCSRLRPDVWQQIKQFILKAVTNNVPSKLVGAKRSHPPWLTARVCRFIKRRDRLAAIAKKSGSEIDRRRFRKARNEVNLFCKTFISGLPKHHYWPPSRRQTCFLSLHKK